MTQDRPLPPDDRPPREQTPADDLRYARLADRWDADTWRGVLAGVALGLLTLPAVTMVLVGLLVLAVQGTATWLLVSFTALVTALLGVVGTVVAVRRGHPGVVHRLAVLAWVWGLVVVVAGVVLALSLDAPERVGVAVLLVLGGVGTGVLGLALWAAARLLPPARYGAGDDADRTSHDGAHDGAHDDAHPAAPVASTTDDVPTQASAPDDTLAAWPEWGGRRGEAPQGGADAPGGVVEAVVEGEPTPAPPVTGGPAEEVVDAEVVEPAPAPAPEPDPEPAPRSTPPRGVTHRGTARETGTPVAGRTTPQPPAPSRPPRRSATSGGARPPRRTTSAGQAGPATERIARTDGDDGPPTQRMPPLDL